MVITTAFSAMETEPIGHVALMMGIGTFKYMMDVTGSGALRSTEKLKLSENMAEYYMRLQKKTLSERVSISSFSG